MQEYNHNAAVGVLGEILPDEQNYVSIHPTGKDQFGIPVPYVHFDLFEDDRRMMRAGIARARAVLEAAGAVETHYGHAGATVHENFLRKARAALRILGRAFLSNLTWAWNSWRHPANREAGWEQHSR